MPVAIGAPRYPTSASLALMIGTLSGEIAMNPV